MSAFFRRFISDETGASAITYGLILALFAAAIITAVQLLDIRLKAGFAHAKPH
jgi:pilus assembly protein Flp/PilA